MREKLLHLLAASLFAWAATALPLNHTDDQVNAAIKAGTFRQPSVNVRPRYRYWLPDASVNITFLVDDIAQLAARGAGGIEFLNYFDYGGLVGHGPATDWDIYGYGTPVYRDVLKAALQAHKDLGLIMDFSMGPQSGQGVPAEPDEPGLEYNLNYYNVSLSAGETYTGKLPGWGSGDLVSALTFATTKVANVKSAVSENALVAVLEGSVNSTLHTIATSSIVDVSAQVLVDGSITVTAPTIEGAVEYYLMASYYSKSYARACVASNQDPQNIIQNGSFAVDHFSPVGAKLTTNFLEKHILIDGIGDLLREVGNYIWEDSVEIPGTVYWTPDLAGVFEKQHGYSIEPYVPLLAGRNGELSQISAVGPHFFVLDTEDQGAGVVGDWRQTMTTLLGTYYDWLVNWTNSYLDLQFSGQIGYNLPTDMLSNIARVNAPETESLSFMNNIDSFRQYVGPANLAGKRVISMEMGSDYLETYTQTWTALLKDGKRAFVTGVNQMVLHGATYSHSYPNTTWPGFTSFTYSFPGQHSRHQPAWDVGYAEAVEYLARTQFVLQNGISKVDLVLWDKQTAQTSYPETIYHPGDLTAAGYTYSYLSPDNFANDEAFVLDGVFAPGAQAFRALIIRANDTLTVDGVHALVRYAHAGLPIIMSGGVPGNWTSVRQSPPVYVSGNVPAAWNTNDFAGLKEAQTALESILSLPNIHRVPYESLAESLAAIGISPRTKVSAGDGTWITHWREDRNGDILVFIYNDGNASTGSISFETILSPSFLNAWTGDETPVIAYTRDDTYTTIDFFLGSTETVIIKFSSTLTSHSKHIVSAPAGSLVDPYSAGGPKVAARIIASNATCETFILSDRTEVAVPSTIPAPISLTNWTLVLEQWLPPTDLFDLEIVANKTNVTFNLAGPCLEPWNAISGSLSNISGIGYYSTSFQWPPSWGSADGAVLMLPPITQGVSVSLNGQALQPVDITRPIADLSQFLVEGQNRLSVKVASTLWNVLTPIWGELRTGTSTPDPPTTGGFEKYGFGGTVPYGIIGEVKILPYVMLAI